MTDLVSKLEYSLREYLDLNITITLNKGKIVIHGTQSNLEEAIVSIFIQGFLAAWNHKNKPLIKAYNPEVG